MRNDTVYRERALRRLDLITKEMGHEMSNINFCIRKGQQDLSRFENQLENMEARYSELHKECTAEYWQRFDEYLRTGK